MSFLVASYNAARFLEAAVDAALAQTGVSTEVIVADDMSTDDSWAVALRLAQRDSRVRVFQGSDNRGPGGARNLALGHARGRWIAVLDSDDLIHPDRSQRLLDAALRTGADVVADDLLVFDEARLLPPELFLGQLARETAVIDLPSYLDQSVMFGPRPNLGFLKPMIRRDFLQSHNIRYDERLRIAEDDDLILQLLAAGATYRVVPSPLYFYRKHGASISHRLSVDHVDRMMEADTRLRARLANADRATSRALKKRSRALRNAWAFTHMLEAVRANRPISVLREAMANPGALPLLRMPIGGAARKLLPRRAEARTPPAPDPRNVLFISRQRILGATNGSSAYLLALADATRAAGMVPHLLQPSPVIFGRTPFIRLRPEMDCFESIRIRGAARVGPFLLARAIGIYAAAGRGVVSRIARRLGVRARWAQDRRAPYAAAAPWLPEDVRYVAEFGRGTARIAIADYVFQTEALPYLIDPGLRSATIMHDLFSARRDQFEGNATADSVAILDEAEEIALLAKADAVIAIQQTEADFVRARVPGVTAVLAPMARRPVGDAQSGDAARLLFVGSNTAPNILALEWFFNRVWPDLRAAAPDMRLVVAGTVAAAFDDAPVGISFRGMVDDLAPLYAEAGIVISPLQQGSGLKIKLVEALAHGKACVVTGVTLQGVERQLKGAVVQADTADDFCQAILQLHRHAADRQALGEAALAAACRHFGPDTAYAAFREWLTQSG